MFYTNIRIYEKSGYTPQTQYGEHNIRSQGTAFLKITIGKKIYYGEGPGLSSLRSSLLPISQLRFILNN